MNKPQSPLTNVIQLPGLGRVDLTCVPVHTAQHFFIDVIQDPLEKKFIVSFLQAGKSQVLCVGRIGLDQGGAALLANKLGKLAGPLNQEALNALERDDKPSH